MTPDPLRAGDEAALSPEQLARIEENHARDAESFEGDESGGTWEARMFQDKDALLRALRHLSAPGRET